MAIYFDTLLFKKITATDRFDEVRTPEHHIFIIGDNGQQDGSGA